MPAAGVLAGLIIGSFIAVLTLRWPAGRGVARGRSHCDTCDATLAARDLVPVLSFVGLRGRCRHCGAAIARRHLWIELAAGGISGLSLALHPGLGGAAGAAFGWGLLTLAILDAENFWLPDRLTLPLGLVGLAAGAWLAPPFTDRLIGVVAGFASLTAIAIGYRAATGRTGLGGGDPKLLAAIGGWLGWQQLPTVVVVAAGLGLAVAAIAALAGLAIGRFTRLPLGTLLAAAAWPLWLIAA